MKWIYWFNIAAMILNFVNLANLARVIYRHHRPKKIKTKEVFIFKDRIWMQDTRTLTLPDYIKAKAKNSILTVNNVRLRRVVEAPDVFFYPDNHKDAFKQDHYSRVEVRAYSWGSIAFYLSKSTPYESFRNYADHYKSPIGD